MFGFLEDFLKSDAGKAILAGGALAATGGMAAPALLGAEAAGAGAAGAGLLGAAAPAAAGAASAAAPTAGLLADPLAAYMTTGGAEGSIMGSGLTGAGGASGAVGSGTAANGLGLLKQASDFAKPIGQAASAANSVKGLISGPQTASAQPAPVAVGQGGSQGLNSLYAQLDQQNVQRQSEEMQRRMQRRQMMGGR